MAITLETIEANVAEDIDRLAINELRKRSPFLLNTMPFSNTVIPGENGGTLVAGYTRIAHTRGAQTRQLNTEYVAKEAKRRKVTVELVPMGARYNIDRVIKRVGAQSEVAFQQDQALDATVAKFHDLFINGVASGFDTPIPSFDGLDALVTGTVTEGLDGNDPYDFSGINTQATAMTADLVLRSWFRSMRGGVTAFFVNEDGAALLDRVNAYLSIQSIRQDQFGADYSTFKGIPYINLGTKPGEVDEEDILTGVTSEDEIIETDDDGVTSIYAARIGMDAVHGYSIRAEDGVVGGGGLFSQWLPDFSQAGAVKPGEVELGPVAIAAKQTRGAGALRVKVR